MTWHSRILLTSLLFLVFCRDLCLGSGVCTSPAHAHHHDDGHHHHHHDHGCGHDHRSENVAESKKFKLPEELAEEEDMRLFGFGNYHQHHHHHHHDIKLSGLGLWINALGCSLLVSLASLICLILLPVIFLHGKPSKAIVDSLALFGAGAMLGDAFLHQLPHAFGGEHSHGHDNHAHHSHHASDGHEHSHSHSHSLEDLSVGLAVLAGIVLFLLVEKIVRYVEANATDANSWSHGHHHHHHKTSKKLKNEDNDVHEHVQSSKEATEKESDDVSEHSLNGNKIMQQDSHLRKRKATLEGTENKSEDAIDGSNDAVKSLNLEKSSVSQSRLVFGYLNLFSDGVHNFTDGMALGSAFLLYGSVGGWSRTLFLLAHELPQEVGDFGILVRSGFSVPKALFFNFLSALVALAGTAMALLLGRDPGQSSYIEGFTAGGFIYISVAGVLAEMNTDTVTLRSTVTQLAALVTGMAVALCISLVE